MSYKSRKHRKGNREQSVQFPYLQSIALGEECVRIQLTNPTIKPIKAFIFSHDEYSILIGEMNAPTFRRLIRKTDIATITPMKMVRDQDSKVQKIPNITFRTRLKNVKQSEESL